MPHIRLKCISEKNVQALSETLPKKLAQSMQTTEDNFSFEILPNKFFEAGKPIESYPFVEVHWFERTQEVKSQSAKIITDEVRSLTQAQDIVVVYIPIEKNNYFENGKSF